MQSLQSFRKTAFRLLIALATALALFSPLASPARPARAAGPYVVDTSTDGPDSNLADGTCSDGVDGCSLRAAIQQATHDNVPTTITFSSGLAGSTLLLDNTYGTIIWSGVNITVDGGLNNISISGLNLTGAKSIFQIQGNDNLLENLTIKQAPRDGVQIGDFLGVGAGNNNTLNDVKVFGNGASGVYVFAGSNAGGLGNTVQSSIIGSANASSCATGNNLGILVDQGAVGTTINQNWIICNAQHGVQISGTTGVSVTFNSIGTSDFIALPNGFTGIYGLGATGLYVSGNIISGNGWAGVWLDNSSGATVRHNWIGTNQAGDAALPNGNDGVALTNGSHNDTIGGVTPGDRNFISGNAWNGVLLDGSGTHDNLVEGNFIGTNFAGTAAIANSLNGARLRNGAQNNTVGGAFSAAPRNVISGNTLDGVAFYDPSTSSNSVDDNFIGLNAAGNGAIPNGLDGVAIFSSNANSIGSLAGSTGQFISGNAWQGIYVENANATNIDSTNYIGVAANGTTPLGNGLQGVLLIGATNSTVRPNTVSNNGGAGVELDGASATGNTISPAGGASNGGLLIDLGGDGHTPNDGDVDTGPNNLLEYPVITAFAGSVITGTACANCTVFIYHAIGDPAAPGGGGTFYNEFFAGGSGNWSTTLADGLTSADVSLVACEAPCLGASNTSEMSPRPVLFLPLTRK